MYPGEIGTPGRGDSPEAMVTSGCRPCGWIAAPLRHRAGTGEFEGLKEPDAQE